jgi:GNAT superfamily N-acetyltransferase
LPRGRREEDLLGCVRALRETHLEDGYPARWPADPARWLTPPELAAAWVVERDGDVLGHVCVVRGTTVRPAEVSRLFVAPAARRQHLGTALLATAGTWAAARDLALTLDVVDDGGPAIGLYERLGWVLTGRRTAEWTTPSGIRPGLRVYRAPTARRRS